MKQALPALALALVAAFAVPADAGQRHRGAFMEDMFKQVDGNGDGAITQAEIDAFHAGRFAAADTDGDGRITLEEATAFEMARAEDHAKRWIARMDDDGDGVVSREETAERHGHWMMKSDANDDGAVTLDEMRQAMKRHWGGDDGDDG
jgi:Ca2+-binding EF-hand superfamily protein